MMTNLKKSLNLLSLWLPVLLYMGLIFYLSDQPDLPQPKLEIPHLDKLAHLILYAGLGCLLYRAGYFSWGSSPRLTWYVMLIVVLYGVSDEIHQSFVPSRSPDAFDVLFDGLGGLVATKVIPLQRLMTSKPGSLLRFLFLTNE